MKKIYEKPILEIEKFDVESKVTTTSELNANFSELTGEPRPWKKLYYFYLH